MTRHAGKNAEALILHLHVFIRGILMAASVQYGLAVHGLPLQYYSP